MISRIANFLRALTARFRRPLREQTAALCWRRDDAGDVEILLVTTRNTRRWTPPRGWPMEGKTMSEAAAVEASEEAGAIGAAAPQPLGGYLYDKRGDIGRVAVSLFPMQVERLEDDYREVGQRDRRWMSRRDAAAAVGEKDLAALILGFRP